MIRLLAQCIAQQQQRLVGRPRHQREVAGSFLGRARYALQQVADPRLPQARREAVLLTAWHNLNEAVRVIERPIALGYLPRP